MREGMISSKELIEEARRQGYKLELRTLRDYVDKGLLPKPITRKRQQERGQGGGMIAFYPDKTKKMLETLLESRNQGLGLEEIRDYLLDQEMDEFLRIFFEMENVAGAFIVQDFRLVEMSRYGEPKLSSFGDAFRKYLDDVAWPPFIVPVVKLELTARLPLARAACTPASCAA
jgi:DNA-binding transcriptional MerR regulator